MAKRDNGLTVLPTRNPNLTICEIDENMPVTIFNLIWIMYLGCSCLLSGYLLKFVCFNYYIRKKLYNFSILPIKTIVSTFFNILYRY